VPERSPSTPVFEGVMWLLFVALLVPAGVVGWVIGHSGKSTHAAGAVSSTATAPAVDPSVASGAHIFVQFACAQCHGPQGHGGVSPYVPALTKVATTLQPAELRTIINHGLGESANPTRPFMPVWGQVISETQVNDLVSYIRAGLPAVPTAEPPTVPTNQGLAV